MGCIYDIVWVRRFYLPPLVWSLRVRVVSKHILASMLNYSTPPNATSMMVSILTTEDESYVYSLLARGEISPLRKTNTMHDGLVKQYRRSLKFIVVWHRSDQKLN